MAGESAIRFWEGNKVELRGTLPLSTELGRERAFHGLLSSGEEAVPLKKKKWREEALRAGIEHNTVRNSLLLACLAPETPEAIGVAS